jgi:hypothetical protein
MSAIMTNVAYLLFTFIACVLGLGLGLFLHHMWSKTSALVGPPADPFASIDDGETTSWEAYTKWQADNNRRFATQVSSCAAAPIVVAGLAWSERTDVVQSVCSTLTKIAGQAYICM